MTLSFCVAALVMLLGAVASVSSRNLVHCALSLVAAFAGLAALYLQLSAQFIGFAQILVYIGAVAILIVFAILLTRGTEVPAQKLVSPGWGFGVAIALVVFMLLAGVILTSQRIQPAPTAAPAPTVRELGTQLMTKYVLPLEVLGLLLTAALIGAVIIALRGNAGDQNEGGK